MSLSLRGLTWRPVGRRRPTLEDVDLTIGAGERVLLAGASGSGKSTLLAAAVGSLGTTHPGELSGEVVVGGRVGLLLQDPGDAVVAERIGRDVAFGPENLGLARDETWRRVDDALARVRLPYPREHFTAALSGGEAQRLALAGVLATRPDLLLLDEPTSMLDADAAGAVRAAVLDTLDDRTLVVVDHHVDGWLEHVDRVVVLDAGRVVADTTPAGYLADPPPGTWVPGAPTPEPLHVPAVLVTPRTSLAPVAEGVDVERVTRSLRGTQRTRALSGFAAAPASGGVTAFVGPSGAGKSTAVAVLGGLLRPTRGTVTPDLGSRRSRSLAADVGWSPQSPEHGFVATTVREEVGRTSQVLGRDVDVDAVLEVLGLGHLGPANPYRLSGGEQRRLALAGALAHRPGLVLLDEPTVGQDPGTWAAVVGWLLSAARAGACVVLSTHDDLVPATRHRLVAGVVGC